MSLSPSLTFPSLSLVPPSSSEESKILISSGAPKLAPRASVCGSVPGPEFETPLCIKCSAPSSLSSDASLSDSDPSSSMCLSTLCSMYQEECRKNVVKVRAHVPNSWEVLCAKLARGSLFQRAIPAFTPTGPCKAWCIAVANESILYWYKLLRSDHQRLKAGIFWSRKTPLRVRRWKRKIGHTTGRGCGGGWISRQLHPCGGAKSGKS